MTSPDQHITSAPAEVPVDAMPLAALLDLPLAVSIELGRTRMSVQELLALGRGSVIRLERLAGEPIDVYVADRRFAEGEVLVINEHFGIRITRIVAAVPAPGAMD
ncbi:MAG: flagellar motor switch protein FliN [Gemmatimonadaceae bacterium]